MVRWLEGCGTVSFKATWTCRHIGLRKKKSISLQWLSAFPETQTSVQNMQIWYIYSTLLNFFYITLSDLFIHAQEKISKYFCMLGITAYPKCLPCIFISFLGSICNQTSLEWLVYAIKAQHCNRLICLGCKSNLKCIF